MVSTEAMHFALNEVTLVVGMIGKTHLALPLDFVNVTGLFSLAFVDDSVAELHLDGESGFEEVQF